MNARTTSYGQEKIGLLDSYGIYLSKKRIQKHLNNKNNLIMADLGSGYHAKLLLSFESQLSLGLAVDLSLSPKVKGGGRED